MPEVKDHSRRRRFLGAVSGLSIGLVIVTVVTASLTGAFKSTEIRDTQQSNSPLLTEIRSLSLEVRSCTKPGGECYKRSQRRTAEAVGQISAGNIIAIVCALDVPDAVPLDRALEQVTACVAEQLAKSPAAQD